MISTRIKEYSFFSRKIVFIQLEIRVWDLELAMYSIEMGNTHLLKSRLYAPGCGWILLNFHVNQRYSIYSTRRSSPSSCIRGYPSVLYCVKGQFVSVKIISPTRRDLRLTQKDLMEQFCVNSVVSFEGMEKAPITNDNKSLEWHEFPWRSLPPLLDPQKLPRHIAVIMDGNGRWGLNHSNCRTHGHQAGVAALEELIDCCVHWQIPLVTVFAFSFENWKRPIEEIDFLFLLFQETVSHKLRRLVEENIRIRFIGNMEDLPSSLRQSIFDAEELSRTNSSLELTIALNYSGRQDIVNVTRRMLTDVEQGRLHSSQIDERLFHEYMQSKWRL
ncbi:undecaprenyl pyrophosphate synthetase [Galdieria sulphuraria]|uniref:Alkyl transferase n=1 Tax=Galdieria sulphuraria TaxID=130081 RepID=M2XEZ3_GALSU|nr:undecaprenyl pyrophosphate synthetase [Galdieria sulphuraria]EME28567.1 undecaprenyl pyrophosphate synthetase [Galdieria sulphuraria]|eukprot:XP_005705087.1 undecaprenyl pyrophosphate synthetase [Galdieria sulphuraria]